MLKKIVIAGFKSVTKRQELPIAPLTVLTGQNSSGKSSVLQSILLSAQSLQSSVHSASVVLNGHIERLGSFTDIVSSGSRHPTITLGFELVPDPNEDMADDLAFIRQRMEMRFSRSPFLSRGAFESLFCEYSFSRSEHDESGRTSDLEPVVQSASMRVTCERQGRRFSEGIVAERSTQKAAVRAKGLGLDSEEYSSNAEELAYDVREDAEGRSPISPGRWSSREGAERNPKGVRLFHFLPVREVDVHDDVLETGETMARLLSGADLIGNGYPGYRAERLMSDAAASDALNPRFAEQIRSVIHAVIDIHPGLSNRETDKLKRLETQVGSDCTPKMVAEVLRGFADLSVRARMELATRFSARKKELRDAVRNGRPDHLVVGKLQTDPLMEAAADYCVHFFTEHVKYVGPLREQPRAVYPLSGSMVSHREVGFRGENAAAVLYNFGQEKVANIRPDTLLESLADPKLVSEPLLDAVRSWLDYLGVAHDLHTDDKGTEGYKLSAAPPGSTEQHDLSHVGVGVSQVLPIVVEALLSSRDSLLLFEQPELHLHPRVQSRLADFFFAMTALGKQCVVETHSEYLVERLRYLHAAAPGTSMTDRVSIFFVELGQDGSNFRKMSVDQYGSIAEWPDGFFDESLQLESDIARAGFAKGRHRK